MMAFAHRHNDTGNPGKTPVPRPMNGISYAFFPDGDRARLLDRRMRSDLASSLGYLHESIAAQWGEDLSSICHLAEEMRRGAIYPPSSFRGSGEPVWVIAL